MFLKGITRLYFALFTFSLLCTIVSAAEKNEASYKIFQFADDELPILDGNPDDWSIVPDDFIIDGSQLMDEHQPEDKRIPDTEDLDVRVIVGWNNTTNRIYFMVRKFDDFNHFNQPNLERIQPADIFEIVIDADNSECPCFTDSRRYKPGQEKLHSVFEQNYHTFMPDRNGIVAWVWGIPRWLEEKPFSDGVCIFSGSHGDSGWSYLEWYITPYDYASHLGPSASAVHDLEEGNILGLSWSFIDWDGAEEKTGAFYNLAHDFKMIRHAEYLPKFRLEEQHGMPASRPKADFTYEILERGDRERSRYIRFINQSAGEITGCLWDFGDGNTSTEKNPIHDYQAMSHHVVTLTVDGPEGTVRIEKVIRTY